MNAHDDTSKTWRLEEDEAAKWIQVMLNETFTKGLVDELQSGVRLCKVINTVWPKAIPYVKNGDVDNECQANVREYLRACKELGMRKEFIFDPRDLNDKFPLVCKNILELQRIVQAKVPHHDLQMLLIQVASIRRSLREKGKNPISSIDSQHPFKSPLNSIGQKTAATSNRPLLGSISMATRQRWHTKRPPAPRRPSHHSHSKRLGDPSHALPYVDEQEQVTGDMSASVWKPNPTSDSFYRKPRSGDSSPSIASVSSASSLCTIESSFSFASNSGKYNRVSGGNLQTSVLLESAAKTSALAAREWESRLQGGFLDIKSHRSESTSPSELADTFEHVDDNGSEFAGVSYSALSLSSFEELHSIADKNDLSEDDLEWIHLHSPTANTPQTRQGMCAEERTQDDTSEKAFELSRSEISRILQFELGKEDGRIKLWNHLIHFEQPALFLAPWRKSVVSKKAAVSGPHYNTVKMLVRKGIPESLRPIVWLICTGALKRVACRGQYYLQLHQRLRKELGGSTLQKVFDSPLQQRIIEALRERNSGLADPQNRLGRVVEHLLEVGGSMIPEEAVFWMALQVVEFMVPLDYFASEISCEVDSFVFASLMMDHDPELAAHLVSFVDYKSPPALEAQDIETKAAVGLPLRHIVFALRKLGVLEWLFGVFAPACIPTNQWPEDDFRTKQLFCRVWDMFVFQGEKVLFATLLSILEVGRMEVLASSSIDEARTSLIDCIWEYASEEVFYQVVSKNCKIVTRKKLLRFRSQYQPTVVHGLLQTAEGEQEYNEGAQQGALGLLQFQKDQRNFLRRMDERSILHLNDLVKMKSTTNG